jgi:NADH-quinone oxidoreductase subunit C
MIRTSEDLSRELGPIRARSKRFGEYDRSGCHADLSLEAGDLLAAVGLLFEKGFFLEDVSGVDVKEGILLAYHFDRYEASGRVVLRVTVPHAAKKVPSIAAVYSGADWHERECFDFFGVEFENHPNLKPLLLPDDLKLRPLIKEKGRRSIYGLLPLTQVVEGGERGPGEPGRHAEDHSSSEKRSRE